MGGAGETTPPPPLFIYNFVNTLVQKSIVVVHNCTKSVQNCLIVYFRIGDLGGLGK